MPKHFFTVRSTVPDASKREAFDRWYSKEHVPDAVKSFGAEKAWRFWSVDDPAVHVATYQFPDLASVQRAINGDENKRLRADFDRDWPGTVRTREIVVLAEEYGQS